MSASPLPSWIKDPPAIEDEVIKGRWGYHALQMANKFYSPSQLAYRRTEYGEDPRIKYMAYFLDVRGLRVMETGPYEGHHSIILEKMGVARLASVESRAENVVKCQRIKEKYNLANTEFIQQDIEKLYNGEESPQFATDLDLIFCVGFLYHVPNPARALQWFCELAPALFLATHYIEPQSPQTYSPQRFPRATLDFHGTEYGGCAYPEGGLADEFSGMSQWSFWPDEADLLRMIRDAGYQQVSVLGKDLLNGLPHITIMARRDR